MILVYAVLFMGGCFVAGVVVAAAWQILCALLNLESADATADFEDED